MAAIQKYIIPIMSIVTKGSRILGHLSAGLVLAMVFIMVYDVVARHVFNDPTIWVDEISGYLLVGITFLGAAYTLSENAHIRVESIVERLGPKTQKWLGYLTDLLSLLFLIIYAWQGARLAVDAYVSQKISPTLLRTPIYLPESAVFIGLTWLCFQMLIHIVRRVIAIHSIKEEDKMLL